MKSVVFKLLSLTLLLAPALSTATPHALLIGISDYDDHRITDLEGPIHDVQALQQSLISQWNFKAENVTTLVNAEATERAILDALDALTDSTVPGDDIIIYFSGHGTSAKDPDLGARLHLPDGSGAIVTSDFNPDKLQLATLSEPAQDGLLVGRHELKPRFKALDKERNVLIMFDACFSGNSARDYGLGYTPKNKRQLSLLDRFTALFNNNERQALLDDSATSDTDDVDFSYQNTVYFGAAAEHQLAVDFSQSEIDRGLVTTIDGKPHGGFTDALLRVLTDTDNTKIGTTGVTEDTTISHARLFNRIVNQFNIHCKVCGHTPVSLPAASSVDNELMSRVILSKALLEGDDEISTENPALKTTETTETTETTDVGVFAKLIVDNQSTHLSEELNGLLSRYASDKRTAPDLYVKQNGSYIDMRAADGNIIKRFPNTMDASVLSQWLAAQQWVKRRALADLNNERGDLHVEFRHPIYGNQVTEGDYIHFTIRSGTDANLLALVLDSNGALSVLYPIDRQEADRILKANTPMRLPGVDDLQIQVTPPWGIDIVLFYALPQLHPLLDDVVSLATMPSIPMDDSRLVSLEAALNQSVFPYSASQIRIVANAQH